MPFILQLEQMGDEKKSPSHQSHIEHSQTSVQNGGSMGETSAKSEANHRAEDAFFAKHVVLVSKKNSNRPLTHTARHSTPKYIYERISFINRWLRVWGMF